MADPFISIHYRSSTPITATFSLHSSTNLDPESLIAETTLTLSTKEQSWEVSASAINQLSGPLLLSLKCNEPYAATYVYSIEHPKHPTCVLYSEYTSWAVPPKQARNVNILFSYPPLV